MRREKARLEHMIEEEKKDNVKVMTLYDEQGKVIQQSVIRNGHLESRTINMLKGDIIHNEICKCMQQENDQDIASLDQMPVKDKKIPYACKTKKDEPIVPLF